MNIFYKVTVEKKTLTLDYNGMVEETFLPRNYTKRIILLQTFGIERSFNFINVITQSILKRGSKKRTSIKRLRHNEYYYNTFKDETSQRSLCFSE